MKVTYNIPLNTSLENLTKAVEIAQQDNTIDKKCDKIHLNVTANLDEEGKLTKTFKIIKTIESTEEEKEQLDELNEIN